MQSEILITSSPHDLITSNYNPKIDLMYLKQFFQSILTPLFFSLLTIGLQAQPTECFDFENLEIGQQFGDAGGIANDGTIPLLFNSDVITTLAPFKYQNGGEDGFWNVSVVDWSVGNADIKPPYLFISNINLVFDFTPLPDVVSQVSFDFADGGGELNFQVNDEEVFLLNVFAEAKKEIAKGVELTIEGKRLFLNGDIKKLAIGGQELGFDNFCYVVNDVAPLCIADLEVELEPCTPNDVFFANVKFTPNAPPSDSFIVRGNGQVYGKFAYGEENYRFGPIEHNPDLLYEFGVVDALDENCNDFVEVGKVICEQTDCKIFDLTVQSIECQDNGTFNLAIEFKQENAFTSGFDAFIDDVFQEFLPFSASEGFVFDGLELFPGIHTLKICGNDQPDCCQTIEFQGIDCNEICRVSELVTRPSECKSNGRYDVFIDFQHESLTGPTFEVTIGDQQKNDLKLSDLPITIEDVQLIEGVNYYAKICVFQSTTPLTTDVFQCCVEKKIEFEPCNNSTSCELVDLDKTFIKCNEDGTTYLEFEFKQINLNADLDNFSVLIDEKIQEIDFLNANKFSIEKAAIEQGEHSITLCYKNGLTDCCVRTNFESLSCETNTSDCNNIYEVYAEAFPCDVDGTFLIDIGFKVENPKSGKFQIIGNGIDYGTFEYGQSFYTVVQIKGDAKTEYEFIVKDLENPNCKGFTTLGPINCDNNADCQLSDLNAEISDCSDEGTVDIKVNFKTALTNDKGFNVYIDEQYIETYGFHQTEFVLNKMDLPSGNYKLYICRNDVDNCCITKEIFLPECGTCAITNVTAFANECETDEYFFVDLKFDVVNPSSDRFRVVGNNKLYGVFEYGKESYELGPLTGDGTTLFEFIVQDLKNEACASFAELEKTINCDEGNVWPGDANDDNIADNFDLLNIGLAFEKDGPARVENISTGTATLWEPQPALDWDFSFKNGVNAKHADCNGDGVINELDILVLEENYLLRHGDVVEKVFSDGTPNDPPLYVDFPALADIEKGTPTEIPIIFGSNDIPAEAYGLAFTLKYDPELITSGEISLTESWLGTPDVDLLTINKNFASDGLIEVALIRKGGNNPFGAGAIGNFIVIIDDIEGYSGDGTIEIQRVQAIDNEGNIIDVHTPKTTLFALTDTEEVFEEEDGTTILFPNPAEELISINTTLEKSIDKIEIHTVSGRFVQTINPQLMQNIDISTLSNGVYIVSINSGPNTIYRKLIKQ